MFQRLTLLLYTMSAMLLGTQMCVAQDLAALKDQAPVTFHGGVNLYSQYYHTNADFLRQSPGSYFLSATPLLTVYGMDIPMTLTFSNQQLAFQQPFNQFGLTPSYKWAKVHMGYSSMRFSRYTLDNIRFLGAGVELTPGPLRIGAMYGRVRKAIQPDSSYVPDPGTFLREQSFAAYARKVYAFRVGVGSARTGVDLVYLHGADDSSSIRRTLDPRLRPAENAVVGLNGQLGLGKHLSLRVEGGASVYTRDVTADTVASDTYAKELGFGSRFINVRQSTQAAFGGEGTLGFQGKGITAALTYRRVDPEYRTMGSYYFQQDLEQYTISTGFGLARNKVRFNGSFGTQRNNLRSLRAYTARRIIGSAAVTANLTPKFGLDAYYSNFGISQRPLTVSLTDTTRLEQISQSVNIAPRYTLIGAGGTQVFTLMLGYDALSDLGKSIEASADLRALTANLGYNYSSQTSGWSYRGGLLYRRNRAIGLASEFQGARVGLGRTFDQALWTVNLDVNLYRNASAGTPTGGTKQGSLSVNRRLFETHNLYVSANLLNNKVTVAGGKSFTEVTASASYAISF